MDFSSFTNNQLEVLFEALDAVSDKIHHHPGDYPDEYKELQSQLWCGVYTECKKRRMW